MLNFVFKMKHLHQNIQAIILSNNDKSTNIIQTIDKKSLMNYDMIADAQNIFLFFLFLKI